MMRWCSLFVFGALLAVGVLLAQQTAFAALGATDVPRTVDAEATSATELEVTWTAPGTNAGDLESYEIEWASGTQTLSADGVTSLPAGRSMDGIDRLAVSYTITDLTADTEYRVQIRGRQGAQVTDWAPAATSPVRTEPAPPQPAAPMGVDAESNKAGTVTVTWESVTGATAYMLQWRTAAQGYSMITRMTTVDAPATMADAEGLENGVEYMFQVLSQMGGVYSDPSMEVNATPIADDPEPGAKPTNVRLTPKGRNMIEIKWDYSGERTDTAIRFDVGWTEAAGNRFTNTLAPQTWVPVPGRREARSFVLPGEKDDLAIDDEYLIAVRVVHADGTGEEITPVPTDWVYRISAPRERTPARVSQVQNVNVRAGDGKLTVTWNEVSSVGTCTGAATPAVDHCGYLIDWRAANQSFDNPERQMRVTELRGVITGLMNGTEYGVIVRAYNERAGKNALSGRSDEARQTPTGQDPDDPDPDDPEEPMTKIGAPTEVMVKPGDMMLMVSWNKPDMGADMVKGYNVQYRQAGGAWSDINVLMERKATIEGLQNGVKYSVRVMAYGTGDMMGEYSQEMMATPTVTPVPALPIFGALALGAGLVAAGRRRLRAQRLLKR